MEVQPPSVRHLRDSCGRQSVSRELLSIVSFRRDSARNSSRKMAIGIPEKWLNPMGYKATGMLKFLGPIAYATTQERRCQRRRAAIERYAPKISRVRQATTLRELPA